MARGDITFFEEAVKALLDGTHDLDTHTFKVAICDNTTTPTAADATPALGDYTEVGTAGTYTAGGTALTVSLTETGGTATVDFTNNPTWAANASNDTDAYWGIIYNDTDASDSAIAFLDLGGPVDMSAGDLTITWNGSGMFTVS